MQSQSSIDSVDIGFLRLIGGLGISLLIWIIFRGLYLSFNNQNLSILICIHIILLCCQLIALSQLPIECTVSKIDRYIIYIVKKYFSSKYLAFILCCSPIAIMWWYVSTLPPCSSRQCPLIVMYFSWFLFGAIPLITISTIYYSFYIINSQKSDNL